jgi:hypothetical protein
MTAVAPHKEFITEVSHVKALFTWEAFETGELTFRKGDIIVFLERSIYKDWWKGFLKGQVGIFPVNYVQKLLPTESPKVHRVRAQWSYEARDTDELSFEKGDIILSLEPVYKGWQRGFLRQPGGGQTGIFSLNYVEEYVEEPEPPILSMPIPSD